MEDMELQLTRVRREPYLHDATVYIPEGITTVDGPDIAARATLVRILALIQRADSGEIRFNGKRVSMPGYRRLCGFLPNLHGKWLPEGARVKDALKYFAALWMVPQPDRACAREMERWGLGLMGRERISRLSFGQQKRFALAVSLVMEPAIWIAEAPFSGLDQPGRVILQDLLWHRTTYGGLTILSAHVEGEHAWPATAKLFAIDGAVGDVLSKPII